MILSSCLPVKVRPSLSSYWATPSSSSLFLGRLARSLWLKRGLKHRAGIEPAHGPFLVRVLDAIVYPDLPE